MECTSHEIAGRDHFELLEKLVDEDYELSQVRSRDNSPMSCDHHVTCR